MEKNKTILAKAEKLAKEAKTWADLSNALFDPFHGEVIKLYPTAKERTTFEKSATYKQLRAIIRSKMKETGLVAGAEPTKSGRFVVRIPRSLHVALEREAKVEGTSLNQLVVTKLAIQLASFVNHSIA